MCRWEYLPLLRGVYFKPFYGKSTRGGAKTALLTA